MIWLLDGNVLAALAISGHEHHARAHAWFTKTRAFATCAVTQGTLLRVHMTVANDRSAAAAWNTLDAIVELPAHEFWAEGFSYTEVEHRMLRGAKQVTDAWLVELAKRHSSKVATFDAGLVALHRPHTFFVPV